MSTVSARCPWRVVSLAAGVPCGDMRFSHPYRDRESDAQLPTWPWSSIDVNSGYTDLSLSRRSTSRFSRMRSEGSRFTWGSGGEAVFAKSCVCDRNRRQPFATVRNRRQPSA